MSQNIDPNDFLMSTGVKSATFTQVGDEVVGFIMRQPEMQQQRDFDSGEPKVWPDGKPMMQLRVVLSTSERDSEDPEDNGERAVYIRGNMQKAVAQAVRQANAAGLEVGGKLLIKYSGNGTASRRGLNPPKLFEARYRKPEAQPVPVPEPVAEQPAPAAQKPLDAVPF